MNSSPTVSKLFEALALAQGEIDGAVKGSLNPHFRSKYADLASVMTACKEPLSKHGLSIVQLPDSDDPEIVAITTVLAHKSGEWVSSRLVMRPTKADPQGMGSAITYARRYSLAAIVGVCPEDDDGNAASTPFGNSTPEANADALADLTSAIKDGDYWRVLSMAMNNKAAYVAANGRLSSKDKARARELEAEAAAMRKEYVQSITDLSSNGDDLGVKQLLGELANNLSGKRLVWDGLDSVTKKFIEGLKGE